MGHLPTPVISASSKVPMADQTIFHEPISVFGENPVAFPIVLSKNRPRKPEKTQFWENHDPKIATGKNHVCFTFDKWDQSVGTC